MTANFSIWGNLIIEKVTNSANPIDGDSSSILSQLVEESVESVVTGRNTNASSSGHYEGDGNRKMYGIAPKGS